MLAQLVRETVRQRTQGIRELIYNRALASSIIFKSDDVLEEIERDNENSDNIESILKDWFEVNES